MKNYFLLFLLPWLLFSCQESNIQSIALSDSEMVELNEVFDSVEVIPLEATPGAYMASFKKLNVYDDYFFVEDYNQVIFLFSRDGKFISNSNKVKGNGHGEYNALLSSTYNPYSKLVEIVTRDQIKFYDTNFNFINAVRIPEGMLGKKELFYYIHDFSENEHILTSDRNENLPIYTFNSKTLEYNRIDFSEPNVLAFYSYQQNCFYNCDNGTIFCPPFYAGRIYKINTERTKINPFISFDYKDKGFTAEELLPYKQNIRECHDYVREKGKNYPMSIMSYNGSTLIMYVKNKFTYDHLLFVNLNSGISKKVLRRENKRERFNEYLALNENCLFNILYDEKPLDGLSAAFDTDRIITDYPLTDTIFYKNAKILKYTIKSEALN